MLSDGWQGFVLVADTREDGCGYDFLCKLDGREVKIEVKTFADNGRVVVTSKELREAASSRADYYLIGILEDENPAQQWRTFCTPDPIGLLLAKGELELQAELAVRADILFDF